MVDLASCLTNLLFFDILLFFILLYCYTNLSSSVICCLFFGVMYLFYGASISLLSSSFFECSSIECNSVGDFSKHLLFYQQFCYQLNHQLLLLFFELLFEAVFIASVADLLALLRSFWPYLLLKFLPVFFTNDKIPYPFTYILSIGLIEYLIFIIDAPSVQWFEILSWMFLKRYDLREKFLINYQTVYLEQTCIRLLNLADNHY